MVGLGSGGAEEDIARGKELKLKGGEMLDVAREGGARSFRQSLAESSFSHYFLLKILLNNLRLIYAIL